MCRVHLCSTVLHETLREQLYSMAWPWPLTDAQRLSQPSFTWAPCSLKPPDLALQPWRKDGVLPYVMAKERAANRPALYLRDKEPSFCLELFRVKTGKTCASTSFSSEVRNKHRKQESSERAGLCQLPCAWRREGGGWEIDGVDHYLSQLQKNLLLQSLVTWTPSFGNHPWKLHFGIVMIIISQCPFVLYLKILFFHQFRITKYGSSNHDCSITRRPSLVKSVCLFFTAKTYL